MGIFEAYARELSDQVTKVTKHQQEDPDRYSVKVWYDTDEDSWNMKISHVNGYKKQYRMFWRTRDIDVLAAGAVRFISMIQYAEDMDEYNATTDILKRYSIEEIE